MTQVSEGKKKGTLVNRHPSLIDPNGPVIAAHFRSLYSSIREEGTLPAVAISDVSTNHDCNRAADFSNLGLVSAHATSFLLDLSAHNRIFLLLLSRSITTWRILLLRLFPFELLTFSHGGTLL